MFMYFLSVKTNVSPRIELLNGTITSRQYEFICSNFQPIYGFTSEEGIYTLSITIQNGTNSFIFESFERFLRESEKIWLERLLKGNYGDLVKFERDCVIINKRKRQDYDQLDQDF